MSYANSSSIAEPLLNEDGFVAEINDGVCNLRIATGSVNAVTFHQWEGFIRLFKALPQYDVGVVVVSGLPGNHFCAGNDFREFSKLNLAEAEAGAELIKEVTETVRQSSVVSIAALHGGVMGSGLMMSCACDIRLGSITGRIGLPEVNVGAYGGYRILTERLPDSEARLLTLSGVPMPMIRAYNLGFVQELLDCNDALDQRANELARLIARKTTGALRHEVKNCMNDSIALPLAAGFEREIQLGAHIMAMN